MKTARDGILARARQQHGKIRALLLRHALTLRVAGESAPFLSVRASSPREREALRPHFYRSIPLELLPLASPTVSMVVADEERSLDPAPFAESIAATVDPTTASLASPTTKNAPARSEAVSSVIKHAVPSSLPEATAPRTAQTPGERIETMRKPGSRSDFTAVPTFESASIREVPEKAIETVLPSPPNRRRRIEEVTPGEQLVSQSTDSQRDAIAEEASESGVTPPAVKPVPPSTVPPQQTERETAIPSPGEDEAALFTPVPTAEARTPAAWLARLKAASSPPDAARMESATVTPLPSSPPQKTPPPESPPISQTARRILHPLVGIDPADVLIYRGAVAREAAQTLGADAFAVDDQAIVLGSDAEIAGDDAPATLALLAHELIHIAQAKTPRFVPPILAAPARNGGISTPQIAVVPQTVTLPVAESDAVEGEGETVARQVESRVRHYAATRTEIAAEGRAPETAHTAAAPPLVPTDDWNGLPAPWEPLPAFLTVPAAGVVATESSTTVSFVPSGSITPLISVGEVAPPIQRAPTERSLPETISAVQAPSPAPSPLPPAPDLDALARQVYDKLKRRLAVEQRQRLR